MANLQDVARAANVSKTTVSRFLNGSLDLPERTAKLIKQAIQDLGYVPNPHARRLSLGRSDTIALIVPDISTPFFATFVAAVEAEADRRNLSLALNATLNRPDRELSYLARIAKGHADGLIFVTNHAGTPELADWLNRVGPCVVVDEDVAAAKVPKLFCDNHEGGRLAGHYLAMAGHRDVMFVGGVDQMISGSRRHAGFVAGMGQIAGNGIRIRRFQGAYTYDAGRRAGREFLTMGSDRPTAIFATSDELLVGLYEVLRESGIRIPHDVSVVGYDDVGPLHLFGPPVTAVRQPVGNLGKRALELLLDLPPNTQGDPYEELLSVKLMERSSVSRPFKTTT